MERKKVISDYVESKGGIHFQLDSILKIFSLEEKNHLEMSLYRKTISNHLKSPSKIESIKRLFKNSHVLVELAFLCKRSVAIPSTVRSRACLYISKHRYKKILSNHIITIPLTEKKCHKNLFVQF